MSSSLCESGGLLQLRRSKPFLANASRKPDTMGSLHNLRRQQQQEQEAQRSDDSEYSDIGHPSLPRPKTILSLSLSGGSVPKSISRASTLPVRVKKTPRRSGSLIPLPSSAIAAVAGASSAQSPAVQVKVNSLAKQTKRKSLNGIFTPAVESEVAEVTNSEKPPSGVTMLNRVKSKRAQGTASAEPPEEGKQQKPKKTWKTPKSLTFSFGSNSDRKRRALGFIGKKGPPSPPTPNSPILMSGKPGRLASGSDVTDCKEVPPNLNGRPQSRSYQDLASSPRGKHRPPPLTNLSSPVSRFYCGMEDSPRGDCSPAFNSMSGSSSRQDSCESLPLSNGKSVSLPSSSRRYSPNVLKTSSKHRISVTSKERKLSDPLVSAPIDSSPDSSPGLQGRGLKKRYSFCVRPSRRNLDPEQGWVSGMAPNLVMTRPISDQRSQLVRQKEMRQHVVRFLVQTEQSYVESLKVILKVYHEPLKRQQAAALVEPSLVKDIFYQIPEICSVHERFLEQLVERVDHWDADRKIGDILVNTFSRCQLMDTYRRFIGNFMQARASIELAKQAKPLFSKFLEQRARDNEGKLTLDDLLIKPVQRIPRYVLFIKDLLKHTAPTHPDHAPLQQALGELTMLAERVNDSERERERVGHHKELLNAVDGLGQLLSPSSHFISYNMVTEVKGHVQKRDRFLLLFSDMLVCAASRRKSTSFKRSSLLNLNSVFADGLKYCIKWHLSLTKTSVAQIQTPFVDKRKQNTIEKMMENLHKDEAVIQEMLEMSASIRHPHQALVTTLKELQAEVRESAAVKKAEFDQLPPECNRIDLISYISAPPTQYTLLFPSLKIKNLWEQEFLTVKEAADCQAPSSMNIAPPTSPLPVQVMPHEELTFVNSIVLQSVRVGMQLTCATQGLAVDSTSSQCLWVCCSDGIRGQVSLLNLFPLSVLPQLVANITVSESPILCIADISPTTPPPSGHTSISNIPSISMKSVSSSSSSEHITISPASSYTSSFASEIKCIPCNKDDDLLFINGELELSPTSMTTPTSHTHFTNSLTVKGFDRVRSNSAPPTPESAIEVTRVPSPATGQQTTHTATGGTSEELKKDQVWPALTLRPSSSGEDSNHCMWLGTEGGAIYIYRVGDNLRYRSNRMTVELGSAVHCIGHLDGAVYVGLADGTLTVLNASQPTTSPRHSVVVGGGAVRACVCVMGEMWLACEGSLHRLDLDTHDLKVVYSLQSNQQIADVHVCAGNGVWVSVLKSSLLHLLHAPSGLLLASIDCTSSVMQVLKPCDPIIRHHKSSGLHITSLHSSPSHLMLGTSAGVVLAMPLPFIEPSLEPHPLPHPPCPVPLYRGHMDAVHFLLTMQGEGEEGEGKGRWQVITGGNGCNDFSSNSSCDVADTASCLGLWTFK